MLDIKYIRENKEAIAKAIKEKRIKLDLDDLLEKEGERKKIQVELNSLQARRNELAKSSKGGQPSEELIAEGKKLRSAIGELEARFKEADEAYLLLMVKVPTIPSDDTPRGKDDSQNVEVFKWGEKPKFDFQPKSYLELAENLDLLDLKRGAKVGGYRGYYVKNEAVLLQMGVMMYALKKLIGRGFIPMIPPTLVKEFVLFGSGYFSSRTYNPDSDEIYKIANDDKLADGTIQKENKFLVGTAEPSLLAYYANEVLKEEDLPLKICGFSQCYRSEIGSYGKDTKGIYRVHEFMKVEQICISRADVEASDKLHQEMIGISKEIHQELGLPYRQIQICTGDMSAGKYKQFDLEAWIPSRNAYGETGSASNFLDWQARRLNVKYKDGEGNKKPVYMLNNTALASPRTLIAILENHQQKDGSVKIPEVLRELTGIDSIGPKN